MAQHLSPLYRTALPPRTRPAVVGASIMAMAPAYAEADVVHLP